MKRALLVAALLLGAGAANAACTNPYSTLDGASAAKTFAVGIDGTNCLTSISNGFSITNPTSALTLTATTTAYTAGQLIANNATAGSITIPSFAIPNAAGGFYLPRLRLSTNDATATAWGASVVQVDIWKAAPTFSAGDRTTFAVATGAASHLGGYSCTLSAEYGDGAYAECAPQVGTTPAIRLASGTSVFWTLQAVTGSGITGASSVFTLTAELSN